MASLFIFGKIVTFASLIAVFKFVQCLFIFFWGVRYSVSACISVVLIKHSKRFFLLSLHIVLLLHHLSAWIHRTASIFFFMFAGIFSLSFIFIMTGFVGSNIRPRICFACANSILKPVLYQNIINLVPMQVTRALPRVEESFWLFVHCVYDTQVVTFT